MSYVCGDEWSNPSALPGGTNKELARVNFGGLSLEDFILPSVGFWVQSNQVNGQTPAVVNNDYVIPDSRTPGTVSITVCDYIIGGAYAGLSCPILNQDIGPQYTCVLQNQTNAKPLDGTVFPNRGSYYPGQCTIELLYQYEIRPMGGTTTTNPDFQGYQLAIHIRDANGRIIGNAAKAWVGAIWQMCNSALPFDIWVHVAEDKDAPIELWYSSQHWTTYDKSPQFSCIDSPWGDSWRYLKCNLARPKFSEGDSMPPSATVGHLFATDAKFQLVILFGARAVNTYSSIKPTPTTTTTNPQTQHDEYTVVPNNEDANGCSVQITQYAVGTHGARSGKNGLRDQYQMEAYLNVCCDYKDQISRWANAQVPAPSNTPLPVYGLRSKMDVTFGANFNDQMRFDYMNKDLNTDALYVRTFYTTSDDICKDYHGDDENPRNVWCKFQCW